jgi:hypothetical protein
MRRKKKEQPMDSRATGRPSHHPQVTGVAFALLAILAGAPIPAHAQSTFFDTTRVLGHGKNECGSVPSCQTVRTPKKTIAAGKGDVLTYNCPAHAPYLVGWDTEQLEHMQVQLVPHRFRPDSDLAVEVENLGLAPGYVIVFLGCSVKKVADVAMMHRRSGVPSKAGELGEH